MNFSGKTSSVPVSGSSASGKSTATSYGSGGGKPLIIPSGQLFAGRSAGGASRSQVYGTRFVDKYFCELLSNSVIIQNVW